MGYVILLWHSLSLPYNYFKTIHCLNFNMQRQERRDVTNDVNANFLIRVAVMCMKYMFVIGNIILNFIIYKVMKYRKIVMKYNVYFIFSLVKI